MRSVSILLAVLASIGFLYFQPFGITNMCVPRFLGGALKYLRIKGKRSSLPPLSEWVMSDDVATAVKIMAKARKIWESLAPFFRSKGYVTFEVRPEIGQGLYPSGSLKDDLQVDLEYPFARRVYQSDRKAYFLSTMAVRVWPARDTKGRDVVIRLVSDGSPSPELEILKFLNTKEARSDPRNHTIPILEFLEYDRYTFAIMPRWGQAFWPDHATVQQIMHMNKTLLEVLVFLHEHSIFHGDFLENNTVMDVLYPEQEFYKKGLRNPDSSRYALIDFGQSLRYSPDIPIEKVTESRPYNFGFHGIQATQLPYNPFSLEVAVFGVVLQRSSRHIDNVVPELGTFYDNMTHENFNKRPTARDVLAQFNSIYEGLSETQLSHPVINRKWQEGKVVPKEN